jgi:hypothetical protein
MAFCTHCGAAAEPADKFCVKCGAAQAVPSLRQGYHREAPRGVGGWLLLLVLGLVLAGPAWFVKEIVTWWPAFPPPPWGLVIVVDGVLTALGVWGGLKLLRLHKNAPAFVRGLLLASIVWGVAVPLSIYGPDVLVTRGVLLRAVAKMAWYLYLRRSRRVALTYGS